MINKNTHIHSTQYTNIMRVSSLWQAPCKVAGLCRRIKHSTLPVPKSLMDWSYCQSSVAAPHTSGSSGKFAVNHLSLAIDNSKDVYK